jgi:hypothetical protein
MDLELARLMFPRSALAQLDAEPSWQVDA